MSEFPYNGPERRNLIDRRQDRVDAIERLDRIAKSVRVIFEGLASDIEIESVIAGQKTDELRQREDSSEDVTVRESAEVRRESEIAKAKSDLLSDLYLRITEVVDPN